MKRAEDVPVDGVTQPHIGNYVMSALPRTGREWLLVAIGTALLWAAALW